MGFELPWALLGLLAAGIPVLVHLMRKRDVPVVALPTIALLRRATVESRRRMRLVDLLLLALRVLLLALLALAAARPFTRVEVAFGSGEIASVVVVLDDSMSMSQVDDGRTSLRAGVTRARTAIDALPPGSQVAVVLAGEPARVLVSLTEDLDAARRALGSLPSETARGTDLPGAIASASRELGGARHDERRLLVLSDFLRHTHVDKIEWPHDTAVDLVRVGPNEPTPNVAITEVLTTPDATTPGRVSIRTEVRSFPPSDREVEVRLVHGNEELDRRRVSLVAGVGRVLLAGPLVAEGDPTARVELVLRDRLPLDDARGVLLRAPAAMRVLIVDGEPHSSRHDDEVSFLARALDVAPAADGVIAYRIVDADSLPAQPLDAVDAIVLANVAAPPPAVAAAIRQFVERGGGLFVSAGRNVDPGAYAARFGDLLPTRLGTVSPRATVGLVPRGERADTGLSEVRTHKRLLLDRPAPGARTTFAFADGAPALVEGPFGEGRTAVFATSIDDDWTDFPYRPGFLPFVVESLKAVAKAARTPERPYPPGEPISLPLPRGTTSVRISLPDGTREEHSVEEGREAVRFESTGAPGAYRVEIGASGRYRDEPRIAFLVSSPPLESDLAPGELPRAPAAAPGSSGLTSESRRVALHPWLLLVAGLVVVGEGLLRLRRHAASETTLQVPPETS